MCGPAGVDPFSTVLRNSGADGLRRQRRGDDGGATRPGRCRCRCPWPSRVNTAPCGAAGNLKSGLCPVAHSVGLPDQGPNAMARQVPAPTGMMRAHRPNTTASFCVPSTLKVPTTPRLTLSGRRRLSDIVNTPFLQKGRQPVRIHFRNGRQQKVGIGMVGRFEHFGLLTLFHNTALFHHYHFVSD